MKKSIMYCLLAIAFIINLTGCAEAKQELPKKVVVVKVQSLGKTIETKVFHYEEQAIAYAVATIGCDALQWNYISKDSFELIATASDSAAFQLIGQKLLPKDLFQERSHAFIPKPYVMNGWDDAPGSTKEDSAEMSQIAPLGNTGELHYQWPR